MMTPWRPLAVALFVALCCLTVRVEAAGDPDLDYWTIETAHFRIHYEKRLEPLAERLARVSESIHDRLVTPLGYAPSEKTEVLLTDDTDNANGSASALPFNTVRLFVTAPDDMSPLGDYEDWQLGLMTHEYTHILHVDNVSGLPAIGNLILGKTFIPNQVQPRWFIEGLATVFESSYTSAGRIRSSLFEMQMRADFLEDNVANLAELSSNARRWPGGTMFYLYGSRFLQWIIDVYGSDVLRAVIADYGASVIPWGINRAIRRQTGRTYVELYEGFVDTMHRRYKKQMRAVERRGLREGRRITFHGRHARYPMFIPERARTGEGSDTQLLYYKDDDFEPAGLYRIDLGSGDGSTFDAELVTRADAGPAAYTREGALISTRTIAFKRINAYSDLFYLPKGETAPDGRESYRERLTVAMRASSPAASPDGRHLVFTRNHRGTTRLMIADQAPDGTLSHVRTLVPQERFDQVFTPAYSPDGRKIAYSHWSAGGFRDIHILDLDAMTVERITHDRAMDMQPAWSPSGDALYFSSDRTGIFNIYAYDLKSGGLRQVTNVRTGAFAPAIHHDGKRMAYVGYTAKGYDLWLMDLDPERYLDAVPPPDDRPAPMADAPPVEMTKAPYSPWRTLRPRAWEIEVAEGDYGGTSLLISAFGSDIVGHHSVGAQVRAEPDAPGPEFTLEYGYHRLPFDLGLRFTNRWTPRADFRFNDQQVAFDEESFALRSAISYRHSYDRIAHSLAASYTAAITQGELPIGNQQPFDPYAAVTIRPIRGYLGTVHLGYSIGNAEGSFFTAGAARGFDLTLGLDLADDFTASEESFYAATYVLSGYLSMPWPGYHTLAMRSSGGLATGTFTQRTIFFVGGYNLEGVGFPDLLTSTAFNGAFVLRGYEPGVFRGNSYLLNNIEYRIPLASPDFGIQTLPLFLRRVDANLFLDWGGAWRRFDFDAVKLFHNGAIIDSPQLHTGAGFELWFGIDLAYSIPLNLRLGWATGFSSARIPGGQMYFIGSSAF